MTIIPCSTSKVSPTALSAMVQTNSLPEDIASWLNEQESTASRSLGTLHKNARRAYPWWKVCTICLAVFPTLNRYQANRNKTCGPACAAESSTRAPRPKPGRNPDCWVVLTCSECGETFERRRAWARQSTAEPMCSKSCNGKARARALLAHPDYGRGRNTPEAIAKRAAKMRGAHNPAWKGGVALLNKKGRKERLVRCPAEFAAMARTNGYVLEHRLVVARALERCLKRAETVHHMNHDPSDNRPENLALFANNRDHKLYEAHGTPAPLWCGLNP